MHSLKVQSNLVNANTQDDKKIIRVKSFVLSRKDRKLLQHSLQFDVDS